jgi:hypothetical protein
MRASTRWPRTILTWPASWCTWCIVLMLGAIPCDAYLLLAHEDAQDGTLPYMKWLPKGDTMNALQEMFKIARTQTVVMLCGTVPGYWFTIFIDIIERFTIPSSSGGLFFTLGPMPPPSAYVKNGPAAWRGLSQKWSGLKEIV